MTKDLFSLLISLVLTLKHDTHVSGGFALFADLQLSCDSGNDDEENQSQKMSCLGFLPCQWHAASFR